MFFATVVNGGVEPALAEIVTVLGKHINRVVRGKRGCATFCIWGRRGGQKGGGQEDAGAAAVAIRPDEGSPEDVQMFRSRERRRVSSRAGTAAGRPAVPRKSISVSSAARGRRVVGEERGETDPRCHARTSRSVWKTSTEGCQFGRAAAQEAGKDFRGLPWWRQVSTVRRFCAGFPVYPEYNLFRKSNECHDI
jgi:hypothetical protein